MHWGHQRMTRKTNESGRLVRLFTKESRTYTAKKEGKQARPPIRTPLPDGTPGLISQVFFAAPQHRLA